MATSSPIDFGARRAIFPGPEAYWSQLGFFATLTIAFLRFVMAKPLVDLERKRLVFGRRQVPFDHITRAKLDVATGRFGRDLSLRFGDAEGPQAIVFLRHGKKVIQSARQQRIVLEILEGSQISLPASSYDPAGKFARWNFPTNLTQEQAIEVVANPPDLQDSLPIPW